MTVTEIQGGAFPSVGFHPAFAADERPAPKFRRGDPVTCREPMNIDSGSMLEIEGIVRARRWAPLGREWRYDLDDPPNKGLLMANVGERRLCHARS